MTRYAALLAALAAVAAQAVGLVGPFQFDDWRVIVDDPAVHSLAGWWTDQPGLRPLLKLSYALNWIASPAPFGFHLVNLLLHALASALVVHLAAASRFVAAGPAVPLLAGLLFALHPLQTEAVTYISGRSASLAAVLVLAATLAHARARPWLAALAFAAAVAAKETAIVLPLALLAWDRWAAAEPRVSPGTLRRLAPSLLVALLALIAIAATPVYGWLAQVSAETRSLADNLLSQIDAWSYLLARAALVGPPSIDPEIAPAHGWTAGLALRGALLAAAASGVWRLGRNRPWWRFALVWLAVGLLPTNSLIPRLDVVNERAFYLAGAGLWMAVAAELAALRRAAVAAAVLGVLAVATPLRCLDYRSEVALWTATSRTSPGKARVWNNLGYALQLDGRRDAAADAYRRALALEPGHAKAAANLRDLGTDGAACCTGVP